MKRLFPLLAVLGSTGAMAAVLGTNSIDTRKTTVDVAFADASFADMQALSSTLLQFHGAIGDSGNFNITGFAPGFVVSVTSGSGMQISNLTPADAFGVVHYTATVIGTSNLTVTQAWSLFAGAPGEGRTFTRFTDPPAYVLDYQSRNSGFVKSGGVFTIALTLPGDWSTPGTSEGQWQLLGLNPDFGITHLFEYDALSQRTVFEAVNSAYDYGRPTVDLHVQLTGMAVPVPEPGAAWLMAAGLLGIGALSAARRR